MKSIGQDTLKTRATLQAGGQEYHYFSLPKAAETIGDLTKLPMSLKVLLENVLRFEDGSSTTVEDAKAIAQWVENATSTKEVPFRPSRILMQDFTGVPAVVDLAAMRDGIIKLGGAPDKVNPLIPVDLVIDHSVMVDVAGTENALHENVELEFARNGERYRFLRWGSQAFENFRVVPPGTGICHQVNLEYLARRSGPPRSAVRSSPIRTRCSAPTATPPWSTASPCSAGAWAGSRRRRPCSASRSPC